MRTFVRRQTAPLLKKLKAELRKVRKSPHDADAIHDLRVAVRRFRQCLRTFEPYFHARVTKRLHDSLRTLMDCCGEVRNRDVALQLLQESGVDDPRLTHKLAKQRFDKEQALVLELTHWRGWNPDLEFRHSKKDAVRELPKLAEEWFHAGDLAAQSASHTKLHEFRILSKHLRYTLELFSDIYGESAKPYMQQLRELQDQLGAINDCVTAARLVRTHRQAASVLKKLLAVRERKFRAAWKRRPSSGILGSNGWERKNMEIYILRHGEAEPRETGVDDGNRALIAKGKRDVRDVLKAARRAKVAPELILTSPLRRAHETAEVATATFPDCPLTVTDQLLPSSDPNGIWKEICSHRKVSSVMLVGHEPPLGHLISFLLHSEISTDLKKGALVRIDCPARSASPQGVLKWILTPRLARAL